MVLRIYQGLRPPPPSDVSQTYDVLNELVIDRGPNAFLTNIECYEKGRWEG